MHKFKQYQTVILDAEITNCPGHSVQARIIGFNEPDVAYVQVLTRCEGCNCGPEGRFVNVKHLKEVHHG